MTKHIAIASTSTGFTGIFSGLRKLLSGKETVEAACEMPPQMAYDAGLSDLRGEQAARHTAVGAVEREMMRRGY